MRDCHGRKITVEYTEELRLVIKERRRHATCVLRYMCRPEREFTGLIGAGTLVPRAA